MLFIAFVLTLHSPASFSESKIVLAVCQKLQIQDYVARRGSASAHSVIDRLRSKVIKDAEEINDSLLGVEMSPVDAADDIPASSSSSDPSALETQRAAPADSIDFYSPERLPVDVSFMEFHPQTPPHEILLQFQRLNLLYACARWMLHADACVSQNPPPSLSYAVVSDREQYCGIITREALVKQFGSFMI